MFNHASLCSGIGGFDLASQRKGWKNVFAVDIDSDCRKKLNYHFPEIKLYNDVKQFNGEKYYGAIDVISAGFPCFTASTLIATSQGYKSISEVNLGDMVLTHLGRYRQVKSLMKQKTNKIYSIKLQGQPDFLETTEEHPFFAKIPYIVYSKRDKNGKQASRRLFTEAAFIPIKDLKKGDYVGYVLDQSKENEDTNSIAFWYLVGRYLGDGWTNNSKRKGSLREQHNREKSFNYKVYICCNHKESDELHKKIEEAGFHATIDKDRTVTKFIICNKEFFQFVSNFGKYAHGKHLTQDCFNLHAEKQKALFEGWFDADGYQKGIAKRITTVSKQLAIDFARVIRNVYRCPVTIETHVPNRDCIIHGRRVNERTWYRVGFTGSNRQGFVEEGILWCPIKEIKIEDRREVVYNLEVDEDNTYTANGIAVHNCQPFSQAGKQRGKADNRYLWDEILRIVKEIKPTFFVGENVPGLLQMAQYESSPPMDSEGNPIGNEGDLYSTTGPGILGKEILEGLEEAGYQILSPLIIPACSVNAIHGRDRIWIIAYTDDSGVKNLRQGEGASSSFDRCGTRSSSPNSFDNGSQGGSSIERGTLGASEEGGMLQLEGEDPWSTGNSHFNQHRANESKNRKEDQIPEEYREEIILSGESCGTDSSSPNPDLRGDRRYERQSFEERSTTCSSQSSSQKRRKYHKVKFPTSQPTVRRGDDGFSFVLDDGRLITPNQRKKSLEQLGNAIVPQVAYEIFSIIEKWYLTHGGQINANS